MDMNNVLSTIIVVAFVVTVVLAIGSYMLYKLRERPGRNPPSIQPRTTSSSSDSSRNQRAVSQGSRCNIRPQATGHRPVLAP